jgi:hypothetical protein
MIFAFYTNKYIFRYFVFVGVVVCRIKVARVIENGSLFFVSFLVVLLVYEFEILVAVVDLASTFLLFVDAAFAPLACN